MVIKCISITAGISSGSLEDRITKSSPSIVRSYCTKVSPPNLCSVSGTSFCSLVLGIASCLQYLDTTHQWIHRVCDCNWKKYHKALLSTDPNTTVQYWDMKQQLRLRNTKPLFTVGFVWVLMDTRLVLNTPKETRSRWVLPFVLLFLDYLSCSFSTGSYVAYSTYWTPTSPLLLKASLH